MHETACNFVPEARRVIRLHVDSQRKDEHTSVEVTRCNTRSTAEVTQVLGKLDNVTSIVPALGLGCLLQKRCIRLTESTDLGLEDYCVWRGEGWSGVWGCSL